MALPKQIVDREYQKFIDAGVDKTAVRVSNDDNPFAVGSSLVSGKIENAIIMTAGIEQSHTFPSGTKRIRMKARGTGRIQLAFDALTSGTAFATIWAGSVYLSPEFKPTPLTIYFQSPIAGLVVELESWA